MPSLSQGHRSQIFFSEYHHDLDYVFSLIVDAYPGQSYWLGIDDRDNDGEWITSTNRNYSTSSKFFVNENAGDNNCGYVGDDPSGLASSSDCTFKRYYVCETKTLEHAPDYPCPKNFIPYKATCLMPSPQRKSYDSAKQYCATKGSIIAPIKEKGRFEFFKAWTPRAVRNDVWVGLRKKGVIHSYDETLIPPLQKVINDELTYSDGISFDLLVNYQMEAKILRGECFALKSSENMELRDFKCNKEIGFVCEWIKPTCPETEQDYQFSHLGPSSSGRECFGIGKEATFHEGTCNSHNDLLRRRWTPKGHHEIDLYRRAYG